MFERELRLYAFMAEYCKMLTKDLTPEHFTLQPAAHVNTPMWIIGHLCAVGDAALGRLQQPKHCGETYGENFGVGTIPNENPHPYPTPEELLATYEAVHLKVADAIMSAPHEIFEAPNEGHRLQPLLPTIGDLLAHMLTTHEAMHLGQLSLWRRVVGLPHAV